MANEIVSLSDWDFDGENGWRNRDPLLREKMRDFGAAHRGKVVTGGSRSPDIDAVIRELVLARA